MRKTKTVRFRETIDVYISPSSQMMDTEDDSNVTELALDLAKRAISAAVKTVKGSNVGA